MMMMIKKIIATNITLIFTWKDGRELPASQSDLVGNGGCFFDDLFKDITEDWSYEKGKKEVVIQIDEDHEIFTTTLKYIRTQQLEPILDLKIALGVLRLSEMWGVDSLKACCAAQLSKMIEEETVLPLLEMAYQYRSSVLIKSCLDYLKKKSTTKAFIKRLVSDNLNIARANDPGRSLLQLAVWTRDVRLVSQVLALLKDPFSYSPLMDMISNSDEDMLNLLIEAGITDKISPDTYAKWLELAIKNECVSFAQQLITKGADANHVNIDSQSMLDLALSKKNIPLIKAVLQGSADRLNGNGHSPLMAAISNLDDEKRDLLLAADADLTICNARNENALSLAYDRTLATGDMTTERMICEKLWEKRTELKSLLNDRRLPRAERNKIKKIIKLITAQIHHVRKARHPRSSLLENIGIISGIIVGGLTFASAIVLTICVWPVTLATMALVVVTFITVPAGGVVGYLGYRLAHKIYSHIKYPFRRA